MEAGISDYKEFYSRLSSCHRNVQDRKVPVGYARPGMRNSQLGDCTLWPLKDCLTAFFFKTLTHMENFNKPVAQRALNAKVTLFEHEINDYTLEFTHEVYFVLKGERFALNYTGFEQLLNYPHWRTFCDSHLTQHLGVVTAINELMLIHPQLPQGILRANLHRLLCELEAFLLMEVSEKSVTTAYYLFLHIVKELENVDSNFDYIVPTYGYVRKFLPWRLERRILQRFELIYEAEQQGFKQHKLDIRAKARYIEHLRNQQEDMIAEVIRKRWKGQIKPRQARDEIQRIIAVFKELQAQYVPKSEREALRKKARLRAEQQGFNPLRVLGISAAAGLIAGGVRGIMRTHKGVNTAIDKTNQILSVLTGILDKCKDITKPIVSALSSLFSLLPKDNFIRGVIISLFARYICKTGCKIAGLTIVVLAGAFVCKEIQKPIIEFFCSDDEDSEVEQQSGYSKFQTLVATIASISIFKRSNLRKNGMAHLLKNMAAIPVAVKGFDALFDVFITIVNSMCKAVTDLLKLPEFNADPRISTLGKRMLAKSGAWLERELDTNCKVPADLRRQEGILIYHALINMLPITIDEKVHVSLSHQAQNVRARIEVLNAQTGAGSGYRPETVALLMVGKPGIGKTMTVQAGGILIAEMAGFLPTDCTEETASNMIFSKPLGSQYYDGYNGQPILLIDDLAMQKMEPGEDRSGIFEVMNQIGSYRMYLNMARCELKGMCPFTSKMVWLTSNMTNMEEINAPAVMLSPDAFKRRIEFHYELSVKPEFRKENSHQLCTDKFMAELKKCQDSDGDYKHRYPWHIWEVFPRSLDVPPTELVPGTGMPYLELLEKVAEKIKQRQEYFDVMVNSIKDQLAHRKISQQSGWGEISEVEDDDDVEFGAVIPSSYREAQDDDPVVLNTTRGELKSRIVNFGERAYQRGWDEGLESYKDHFYDVGYENATEDHMRVNAPFILAGAIFLTAARAFVFYKAWKFAFSLVGTVFAKAWKFLRELVAGVFGHKAVSQSNFPNTGKKPKRQTKPTKVVSAVEQQATTSSMLADIVFGNTYKAAVVKGNNWHVLGQILWLKTDKFVMPHHFLTDLEKMLESGFVTEEHNVMLAHANIRDGDGLRYKAYVTIKEFMSFIKVKHPERDLCFGVANKHVRQRRDVSQKFLTEEQLANVSGSAVRLDVMNLTSEVDSDVPQRTVFTSKSVYIGKKKQEVKIGAVCHKHFAEYFCETVAGDCGAPLSLLHANRFNSRIILGLHVGARTQQSLGYATLIPQELVDAFLASTKEVEELTAEETAIQSGSDFTKPIEFMEDPEIADVDDTTQVVTLVSEGVSAPVQSKLQLTHFGEDRVFDDVLEKYYGEKPVPQVPMVLGPYRDSEGKKKFPLAEAIKPYVSDLYFPDTQGFQESVHEAMQPFNRTTLDVHARVLTTQEAIVGNPTIGLKGIPRSTSVGYPMCTTFSSKKIILGCDEYDLENPYAQDLLKQVDNLEEMLKQGKRPFFIARGFLKDETRKEGKNARYIAGTDMRYYILCRKYFGHYVASLSTHTIDSGICIGLNQYQEWDQLKSKFDRVSDKVWDGDFTAFDSQQQPGCLWAICEEINQWYEQRGDSVANSEIRRILFLDLVHSRHLYSFHGVAHEVHQWQRSLPSGHFLTSTVNSMLSMSLLVDAFRTTTGMPGEFWQHCAAVTLGDDNLCGASDEVIDRFNQVTMAEHMWNKFRYTYTAGRKGEELKPYMSIEDVTFLQRRFSEKTFLDNGVKRTVVCCPIRPESFLSSMYYIKRSNDPMYYANTLCASLENALEELSMHTEEMWQEVAPRLVSAKMALGKEVDLPTTDSSAYLKRVLERVPVWL